MSQRFTALNTVINRPANKSKYEPKSPISEIFGSKVFTLEKMRNYIIKGEFERLAKSVAEGKTVDVKIAEHVANAMKSWAMEHGATHYTHWFQPLTGLTAEKHDSFFELKDGKAIERFSSSELVQQEPDASSLPSGGLRNTFEARGYTAWDPTSPAFLYETPFGLTLCIPTVFISYTGEALDFKAPLLKTINLIEEAAKVVCKIFDKRVNRVYPTLGPEQEYFLIDRMFYESRPDIILSGRTLFGKEPAKGQQMEDHYFGSIPERVLAYIADLERHAHELGIPIRTRHNEVAPGQYECAPMFEELNISIDHNQLLMDLMDKIALRHNFKILLHEKPFAGVNGSGKHNNWSLATNTGKNLFSPGKTPKDALQFLTFLVVFIKAVYEHNGLLRATIASAENDHRLGANEAPPAIISIFLGKELTEILLKLESVKDTDFEAVNTLKKDIGIGKIPNLQFHTTDRNRTSPMGFTGNKFEYRAVGSSANNSAPMTVLNTIVADQLIKFKSDLDKKKEAQPEIDFETAILDILRSYLKKSKNVLFEGDNYTKDWEKEAKKRGLKNLKKTPEALKEMISKENIDVFVRNNVFTEKEIHARYEILLEAYIKQIQIEARLIEEIAINQILPTAVNYQNKLIENVLGLKELGIDLEHINGQVDLVKRISKHISLIRENVKQMVGKRKKANDVSNLQKRAENYAKNVLSLFEPIRYSVDKLEQLVDDELWPLPKYREMLFIR